MAEQMLFLTKQFYHLKINKFRINGDARQYI